MFTSGFGFCFRLDLPFCACSTMSSSLCFFCGELNVSFCLDFFVVVRNLYLACSNCGVLWRIYLVLPVLAACVDVTHVFFEAFVDELVIAESICFVYYVVFYLCFF